MEKLILIDVGCAGGFPEQWNEIPDKYKKCIGVDANIEEIKRRQSIYPKANFIAAQVGKGKTIEELKKNKAYEIWGSASFVEDVIPLSSVHPSPDFIKIDVDGYDLEVIESGIDILESVSGIYIECQFGENKFNPRNTLTNQIDFLREHEFYLDFLWGQKIMEFRVDEFKGKTYPRCYGNALFLKDEHKLQEFWQKLYKTPVDWNT
jgi:hypothetical protein